MVQYPNTTTVNTRQWGPAERIQTENSDRLSRYDGLEHNFFPLSPTFALTLSFEPIVWVWLSLCLHTEALQQLLPATVLVVTSAWQLSSRFTTAVKKYYLKCNASRISQKHIQFLCTMPWHIILNSYSPDQSNIPTHGGKQKNSVALTWVMHLYLQKKQNLTIFLFRPIKNSSLLLPCFVTNQHWGAYGNAWKCCTAKCMYLNI